MTLYVLYIVRLIDTVLQKTHAIFWRLLLSRNIAFPILTSLKLQDRLCSTIDIIMLS